MLSVLRWSIVSAVMLLASIQLFPGPVNAQTIGTPGNNHNTWVNPNHGSGSIVSCSADGKFCWNITIGDSHHWGHPIQYHGYQARRLIANGQIEWANMTHNGIIYLGVWSGYNHRPFDCTINVGRHSYHCQSHH